MEDQFQIVKTWRGYILVSSCLLPSSSAERARIYPDYLDNNHAHTARDATPVAQNQVAQEGNPQLPTPSPYHCYITQVPSPRDLRYEKGLLGTPGESRMAAASERFVEPDKMSQSIPTRHDEAVHSPDSLQPAVPSWKRGSRDWEHGSRTSSGESTSSASPAPFSKTTQPAPATPLGSRDCCTSQNWSRPVPAPPSASSPSLSGTPRLEVRPKRRLSNGSIEDAGSS
ncbi:hypothetical protein X797_007727 [Metarhizium robertsii]|uniref:Uncharacterized protein n=2 Tax=Metarhizium robertsii TaxID=568076 RepID=E9FCR9_METRA|nr:uncharacterized protein MAA_10068 [Metarhizium robertsii ARSEF 23]EFY94446.1 hypothetical protein MAA_10068 [Metarhizium robertsii ARSEF 23]EXU99297.1 hypothetical protein X797_007727 [Metarhizium robertsii]